MAVTLAIDGDDLVVRLSGADVVWALARELRVPRMLVRSVSVAERPSLGRPGMRIGGSYLPGVLTAGRYRRRGQWSFWVVHRARRLLVVECVTGARFDRIVLEVPDPDGEAARLQQWRF